MTMLLTTLIVLFSILYLIFKSLNVHRLNSTQNRFGTTYRARERSKAIDFALKKNAEFQQSHYYVLPLGAFPMRDIIAQLKPRQQEAEMLSSRRGMGASTHHFTANGLSLDLIDVGLQRCERRKWFHQFHNVAVVLFVVDLPSYDQEVSTGNVLMGRLGLFDSVINHKHFVETVFVLFFSGVTVFRQKLGRKPFGECFPGYEGGDTAMEAEKHLRQLFRGVNREGKRLWEYFVDPYDAGNIELVGTAVKESIGLESSRVRS